MSDGSSDTEIRVVSFTTSDSSGIIIGGGSGPQLCSTRTIKKGQAIEHSLTVLIDGNKTLGTNDVSVYWTMSFLLIGVEISVSISTIYKPEARDETSI